MSLSGFLVRNAHWSNRKILLAKQKNIPALVLLAVAFKTLCVDKKAACAPSSLHKTWQRRCCRAGLYTETVTRGLKPGESQPAARWKPGAARPTRLEVGQSRLPASSEENSIEPNAKEKRSTNSTFEIKKKLTLFTAECQEMSLRLRLDFIFPLRGL